MSLTHLGPGSTCPPYDGKLRLYSMVFCPFAQRPRIVLALKSIPYETVNIKLKKKPEWYSSVNPDQLVPTLQIDQNKLIHESLVICDYLDTAYPGKNIIPEDPYEFARHKLIVQDFNKPMGLYYKLAKKTEDNVGPQLNDALVKFMTKLKDDFFGGKEPSYADYMLWPWLERLEFLQTYYGLVLDDRLKNLVEYVERMKKIPVCKELMIDAASHNRFFETYLNNEEAEYDHGNK